MAPRNRLPPRDRQGATREPTASRVPATHHQLLTTPQNERLTPSRPKQLLGGVAQNGWLWRPKTRRFLDTRSEVARFSVHNINLTEAAALISHHAGADGQNSRGPPTRISIPSPHVGKSPGRGWVPCCQHRIVIGWPLFDPQRGLGRNAVRTASAAASGTGRRGAADRQDQDGSHDSGRYDRNGRMTHDAVVPVQNGCGGTVWG